jgi:hypothetical protein
MAWAAIAKAEAKAKEEARAKEKALAEAPTKNELASAWAKAFPHPEKKKVQ